MNAGEHEPVSILVVDDHPENVLALEAMLSHGDYRVVKASSGTEALRHVLKHEFAAILLDVVMPLMDGFETARLIRMREASSSVPIIFLTANAGEAELVYKGYAVGAVDYLIKPLDPDIVRAKVAVFADLFRKTQQIRRQELQLRELERQRSERALRESELLYESTFNEAAVGIGHVGADGRFLRVNRKLCEIFGYREGELLRQRLQGLSHPEDGPQLVGVLRRMIAGELESDRRELRCSAAGGAAVWVHLALSVLRGSSLQSTRFIAVVEDVTEHKLSAERQRVLAAVGESLLRSLDQSEAMADAAGRIVPSLADWCLIDLRADDDGPGEAIARHTRAEDTALVLEFGRLVAREPRSLSAAVLRSGAPALLSDAAVAKAALAGDAQLVPLLSSLGLESAMVVPLCARDRTLGTITLALVGPGRRYGPSDLSAARDLAHRVALGIENARLYRKAQLAISARDEFLSIASHELRTPLTPLQITFHRLLRDHSKERIDRVDQAKLRTLLIRGDRQVGRLTALVDNLLDVSRISSGRLRLQLERFDLSEAIRELANRAADELARAGCRLDLRLEAALPGRWDRLRLEQVVTNLLANAMKYGAGQPIELSAGMENGRVWFGVRDHGIGIEPQFVERIFGRFERAVPARSYGGLGLGLYIARQIVEAHGGTIRVTSQVGGGSEFVVELPIETVEAAGREDAGEPGEARQHETESRAG